MLTIDITKEVFMFKVVEVPLKSNDEVTLELPINSKFLGIMVRQGFLFPIALVLVNSAQTVVETVKLVTVSSDEEFGSPIIGELPNYVGTFQHVAKIPGEKPEDPPKLVQATLHVFMFNGRSNATSPAAGSSIILPQ